MELTQLLYFKTAAEMEHFTHAAEKLNITQPTLSKTVSRLEEELGVKFFDRDGTHVRLNIYGQTFLTQVNEALLRLEEGKQLVAELLDSDTGEIHIAATLTESLSPFIRNYLLEHPQVHMHQIQATAEEMTALLERREIDFGISTQPLTSLNIEWVPLIKEELGLIVSVDNHLAERTSIHFSEAKDERFLVQNCNEDTRKTFMNYCFEAGFTPNIYFEGDQSDLIGELVAKNIGVAFGSRNRHSYMAEKNDQNSLHKKTRFVALSGMECFHNVGIGVLKGRTLSLSAKLFYDYILENYCQRPAKTLI